MITSIEGSGPAMLVTDAFARWEEGEISAREALQAIVSAEYVAADAAFKAAEQRKKQVRGQLEQLVQAIGEPVVCAGFELAWREGTMGASYPAQRVDWAVRTLHTSIAQLLGCEQLPQAMPPNPDDASPTQATYLVPHALLEELIATVEHLAAGREERVRAGALYIISEEAKQRQERRQGRQVTAESAV
jgi:predicted NBD/HSP70 family sugar kinase